MNDTTILRKEFIGKVKYLPYLKLKNDPGDILYADFGYKDIDMTLRIVKNIFAPARLTYAGIPIMRHLIKDVKVLENGWDKAELILSNRHLSGIFSEEYKKQYWQARDSEFWEAFYRFANKIHSRAKRDFWKELLHLRFKEAFRDFVMRSGSKKLKRG